MGEPLKVFISYSHEDTNSKNKLRQCLAVMENKGLITIWHDNEILPGDKWYEDISKNLPDSDILLYLVSASSLASKNCNKELAEALSGEIRVIPIILEDCDWLNHQLSDIQALPDKGKPINEWQPESKGWQNVVEGLREVVDKIQVRTSNSAKKEREWLLLQLGNCLVMLRQTDKAIAAYSRAIALNPKMTKSYCNRGVACLIKREVDRAITDFNQAIELNPNDALAYNNRGTAYFLKGEVDRAIKDHNQAIKLNPNDSGAYNNRGAAYLKKGAYDQAIKDLNKAIELNPNDVKTYNIRGTAYHIKGTYDRAIKDYNEVIKLDPNDAFTYHKRGFAYFLKGTYDCAIRDLNKAIELNPDYDGAYNIRGATYFGKNEPNRAIENYNKAIELNPDYAEAYYNRGEAWLRLRKWDKAKTDLTDALNLGVDIIAAFRKDYKNVAAFERKYGLQLPADIAAILTQRRRSRFPSPPRFPFLQDQYSDEWDYYLNETEEILSAAQSPDVVNLFEELRNAGIPLGQYVETPSHFGIETGMDDAFVVDRKMRDKLIAEHPSSADILKPFLRGRNIRRWQVDAPDLWLIFTHREIDIDTYPAIQKHLKKYRDSLSKRTGKHEWYELQATAGDSEYFTQPKLVCPNRYNHQTFAVDTDGLYCEDTCYLIPTEETWLCGVLNSNVVEWFYSQMSDQLTADELRALSGYMLQIPIPNVTSTQKALIGKIVNYLIYLQKQPTTNSKDLAHARDYIMLKYFERIIDGLVYECYLPDALHHGDKYFSEPLLDEHLPQLEEISNDKMTAFREIFEHLYERTHHFHAETRQIKLQFSKNR